MLQAFREDFKVLLVKHLEENSPGFWDQYKSFISFPANNNGDIYFPHSSEYVKKQFEFFIEAVKNFEAHYEREYKNIP